MIVSELQTTDKYTKLINGNCFTEKESRFDNLNLISCYIQNYFFVCFNERLSRQNINKYLIDKTYGDTSPILWADIIDLFIDMSFNKTYFNISVKTNHKLLEIQKIIGIKHQAKLITKIRDYYELNKDDLE